MGNVSLKQRHVGTGTFRVSDRMREYIQDVLNSGRISYGPYSRKFEKEFAALHNCQYGILSNSGTSSLQVALQALKEIHNWYDGDEVIVPATTFVATANIVRHAGMQPKFVDIVGDTYNIDPQLIEKAVTDRTRAIIPVHLFGQPADMDVICEIAKLHNLRIIEDSCETMFVEHKGKSVGSWGDVSCFSFYAAHLLVTGVGGMGITNDPNIAAKMRSLVNHGLSIDNLNVDDNFAPRNMLGRRFTFDRLGHSFRLTELEAALGLAQIYDEEENGWSMLRIRRRNARHLSAGLEAINTRKSLFSLPSVKPDNTHAWMMFPIVINNLAENWDKRDITTYLNSHGIETRDMLPILGQPIYKYLDRNAYPISDWVERDGFYIGCHQYLTPDDIKYVIQVFNDFVDEVDDL